MNVPLQHPDLWRTGSWSEQLNFDVSSLQARSNKAEIEADTIDQSHEAHTKLQPSCLPTSRPPHYLSGLSPTILSTSFTFQPGLTYDGGRLKSDLVSLTDLCTKVNYDGNTPFAELSGLLPLTSNAFASDEALRRGMASFSSFSMQEVC